MGRSRLRLTIITAMGWLGAIALFAPMVALGARQANAAPNHAVAWPPDPSLNVPVCTAAYSQRTPAIAPCASGGAYIAWTDFRAGQDTPPGIDFQGDIYVQRVTASGAIAPGWPVDGVPVCTAPGRQVNPVLVRDAEDGVYVVWEDTRGFDNDVYAQRITPSGTIARGWPVDGLPVVALPFDQNQAVATEDGEGGLIVAWSDIRDTFAGDIYAQKITSSGGVAPNWPVNGVALTLTPSPMNEENPAITSDGAGGAIVAWDLRSPLTPAGIYAQHITRLGLIDSGWPSNGLQISQ
jgi:hypothetical protein